MIKFLYRMEDLSIEASHEPRIKKTIDRSAAYPAITIEDGVRFVSEFYKHFRKEAAKRDDALDLIEGAQARHLAAACYYMFLSREKDSYKITDHFRTVTNSINERERKLALLDSFEAPKLYGELLVKFDGDELPKEKELKAHLSRFHKITEEASPLAAEVFLKNAKYCGILDDDNKLKFEIVRQSLINNIPVQDVLLKDDSAADAAHETPSANVLQPNKGEEKNNPIPPDTLKKPVLLLEEINNKEEIKVRLTGRRFAYFIYPGDLNKTDVEILKKEIEQLALIVE